VLLPQTDLEAAQALAERLREAVTEVSVEVEGDVVRFSSSFGLTLLHPDDEDIDMPMARADAALYAAKFAGRNRVKSRIR
jgi:diguanylate cyclase (GGDEF)-like protein